MVSILIGLTCIPIANPIATNLYSDRTQEAKNERKKNHAQSNNKSAACSTLYLNAN